MPLGGYRGAKKKSGEGNEVVNIFRETQLTEMGLSLSCVWSKKSACAIDGMIGRAGGCMNDPTGLPPNRWIRRPSSFASHAFRPSAKHTSVNVSVKVNVKVKVNVNFKVNRTHISQCHCQGRGQHQCQCQGQCQSLCRFV